MIALHTLLLAVLTAVLFSVLQKQRGKQRGKHLNSRRSTINSVTDPYHPSVTDVLAVKAILLGKGLPIELVDVAIDQAEYWPYTFSIAPPHFLGPRGIRGRSACENLLVGRSFPLGYVSNAEAIGSTELIPSTPIYTTKPSTKLPSGIQNSAKDVTKDVLEHWVSQSIPRGEYPCRKIVITIKSHDQGWGGNGPNQGTYTHSNTWFDYGIERLSAFGADLDEGLSSWENSIILVPCSAKQESPEAARSPRSVALHLQSVRPEPETHTTTVPGEEPSQPLRFNHDLHPNEDDVLQKNKVAVGDTQENVIVWKWTDVGKTGLGQAYELVQQGRGRKTLDGSVVRGLRIGDSISVWGKARFPGWVNTVEEVSICVFWAV